MKNGAISKVIEHTEEEKEVLELVLRADRTIKKIQDRIRNGIDINLWEIEDEEEYRGTYDNCGRLSSDFAVVCNMKKGETCYFRVSSYEYYGDAFYLGVKDINDYQSII